MKILFVGNFERYWEEIPDEVLVVKGFLGMNFVYMGYFNSEEGNYGKPNEFFIKKQLEKTKNTITILSKKNIWNLKKVVNKVNPDVVLFSLIGNEDYNKIKNLLMGIKAKKVIWTFDWMFHNNRDKWFIPQAQLMDLVVTTDSNIDWKKYNINQTCIRQGCDKELHQRVQKSKEYSNDIVFVGNVYQEERKKYLCEIAQYFDLKMYGTVRMTGIKQGGAAFNGKLRKVYSSCKIALGDKYPEVDGGYWSNRVYIALGCGAFFITPYIKGLEKEFENKKHLVWFHSTEEAIDLINYYLYHPKERKAIADAGCELVHKKYSYENRVKQLLKEIKKL